MMRWSDVGAMRLLLLGVAVVLMPFALASGADPSTGMGVLFAYVAPSLVVIMFFVLLLDALMNRVFMIEREDPERGIYRLRMRLALAAVTLLVLFWGPFFYQLVALYSDL